MGPSPGLAHSQERWMTVANLWRHLETADGSGGATVAWSQVGTTRATYALPSPAERQSAAQEGVEISHVLKIPQGDDVRRGDRLVIDGHTIEVVSIVEGSLSSVQHARGRQEPWDEPTS